MSNCKNCEHEIMEFSKDKKNWEWEHKSGWGEYVVVDKKCLKCKCNNPEPFGHSDNGDGKNG